MIVADMDQVRVYVRPGVTDMRKAINGLSIIVAEHMQLDPFSGALYLFCNRYRRILKGLLWDRNGFWLIQKRLERDRFPWPDSEEAAREITPQRLRMLLDGIDFLCAPVISDSDSAENGQSPEGKASSSARRIRKSFA